MEDYPVARLEPLGHLRGGAVALAEDDGLSVVASRFTVEDQATTAALTASDMWKRTHDIERTYQAALLTAQAADAHNNVDRESFVVIGDGTVTQGAGL